jgi:hypothetical protein
LPLVIIILVGWARSADSLDGGPAIAAVALAIAAGLGERGIDQREIWWGSPPAYLLIVALATLVGQAGWGIGVAGLYAAATLASVIERLRRSGLAPL